MKICECITCDSFVLTGAVAALRVCGPQCEKSIWAPQNDDICREVRGDSPPENI